MSDGVRTFETGASRSDDAGKPDYEGYLSPQVLIEFGKYMTKHRKLPNGDVRASDNWQKGIPRDAYMKSLWRHFVDLWVFHRGGQPVDPLTGKNVDLKETLAAVMFNTQGYFHETIKDTPAATKPVRYRAAGSPTQKTRWWVKDGKAYVAFNGCTGEASMYTADEIEAKVKKGAFVPE